LREESCEKMFNVRKMPSEEGKRATVECKVVTLLVQELFEMLPKRGQKAAKKRPKSGQTREAE